MTTGRVPASAGNKGRVPSQRSNQSHAPRRGPSAAFQPGQVRAIPRMAGEASGDETPMHHRARTVANLDAANHHKPDTP